MEVSVSVQPLERMYELTVPRRVLDAILSHVKDEYPVEACGVLLGRVKDGSGVVERSARLRNVLASSYAFWFDVREWMATILEAKREGLNYIGIYHSHRREQPLPSLSDIHRMLECPGEIWLIVAYLPDREPRLAAYRVDDFGSAIASVKVQVV